MNDEVRALGNPARINERCLELQQRAPGSSSKKSKGAGAAEQKDTGASKGHRGCPFVRGADVSLGKVRDAALAQPLDLEDLARVGRELGACPYYGKGYGSDTGGTASSSCCCCWIGHGRPSCQCQLLKRRPLLQAPGGRCRLLTWSRCPTRRCYRGRHGRHSGSN